MFWRRISITIALVLAANAGIARPARGANPGVSMSTFGKMPDGETVNLYTLTNRSGMKVAITNYGGRIVSIIVPDRKGQMADVALGFDNLDGYLATNPFFGALVGRYANRIGGAKFALDGKEYHLAANDGPDGLHGGLKGFDKQL